MPLDLRTLAKIYNVKAFNRLRYPIIRPQTPPFLQGSRDLFKSIKDRDVLLHHPYDDFDVIVRFIKKAARDPQVTRISHTLYRTSRESPIMEALKMAARNGKKVTVYVEIKARFDELNNIRWAEELRKAGARVVRPMGGFKVHCKMTQVIRRERGDDVSYLHLGTGNYHPGTARQYTDLGLLTCDEQLGKEAALFFGTLTRRKKPERFKDLMVAPGNLHYEFEKLIRQETLFQLNGGRGHIIAKMNSLVDQAVIDALYAASRAGVRVDLIVRGVCCLVPGLPGLSENIRVRSLVGRFLEHVRACYFHNDGGEPDIYAGSADWMPRNFFRRVEVVFPLLDPALRRWVLDELFAIELQDNENARVLGPDGGYLPVPRAADAPAFSAQSYYIAAAGLRAQSTPESRA